MQVVTENKQNLDLQNIQEQVSTNDKSQQCQASSIEKKYVCYFEDCKYSFLYPYQLKKHIERHSGEHKHECDLCEKKFFSLRKLREHEETHGVISSYACSNCDITFSSLLGLQVHNRSKKHLAVLLKACRYTCDICPETFITKQEQTYHYSKLHPKYRPYPCIACNKSFITERVKKIHYETIHNGKTKAECKQKRIYKCDLCAEIYRQANKLKKHHQNKHPNQKPYICNLCDKKFLNKSTKVHHQKTQHEELLKNHKTTLASNDKQNFYQDENKDQTLELADKSLPSTQETIKEDNNQYQLLEWSDGFQSDIASEESFFNENDISDISCDINELKQMMDL